MALVSCSFMIFSACPCSRACMHTDVSACMHMYMHIHARTGAQTDVYLYACMHIRVCQLFPCACAVLDTDELIMEVLVPVHLLEIMENARPIPLPRPKLLQSKLPKTSIQSTLSIVFVFTSLAAFTSFSLVPYVDVLIDASDAICGGDVEFITTIDGAGMPAWAYPDTAQPSKTATRGYPFGNRDPTDARAVEPANARFYSERIFDKVAQQFGKDFQQVNCTDEVCLIISDRLHVLAPDAPSCCLVKKIKVPSVDGGTFSVATKSKETVEDAIKLWNPTCTDSIGWTQGYTSILRGGLSDAVNSELWQNQPDLCDGICTDVAPMCAEGIPGLEDRANASRYAGDRGCINPMYDAWPCLLLHLPSALLMSYSGMHGHRCHDVWPFCKENSVRGVRARQICPVTCGCSDPLSPLALSLPKSGCGDRCKKSGAYLQRRKELPCEDMNATDPRWVALIDSMQKVAATWPLDWKFSASVFFSDLGKYGCAALRNDMDLQFPSMNIFSVNMCVEHGSYYPVKPLSYFCPRSCGCRSGDPDCPDSCPSPKSQMICPAYMRGSDPFQGVGYEDFCPIM